MGAMELVTKKNLMLFAGRGNEQLSKEIAEHLKVPLGEIVLSTFANGELYCRFGESIRGADVFILQSHCEPINERIMEQLLMLDAAKRASAKRITAVCPFYGYARQDRKAEGREPISARLLADCITVAGADRVVTVDDMIDPAGTITSAAELLTDRGATDVYVASSHGVLSGPAVERLANAPIREVVLTNTLPIPGEKQFDNLTVLSIAPIVAKALDAVFADTSVSNIFRGDNV